jgi:metallo-beta-lactamase family protein
MKIAFHGAARTVTGSKHLLTLKNGNKYLLDCGMFQGMGNDTDSMNRHWGFEPTELTHVILSHAHIDHSGLLPKLVKDGFAGKIFCTPASRDLAILLLEDSAEIQQSDIKYVNKRRAMDGLPYLKPLYSLDDAQKTATRFHAFEYDIWYRIDDFVALLFI